MPGKNEPAFVQKILQFNKNNAIMNKQSAIEYCLMMKFIK